MIIFNRCLMSLSVFTLVGLALFAAPQQSAVAHEMAIRADGQTRVLFGLEPEVLNSTSLALHAGHCADGGGREIMTIRRRHKIDLTKNGLNGLDKGRPRVGQGYYIYVVETRSGEVGAVVSASRFVSEFAKGRKYSLVRKLPWGFVYQKDGIPPMHLSNWPKPFTRFTMAESTPKWRVLRRGRSSAWTPVDVSKFVPDNARMAYLQIEVTHKGRRGKSAAYVRVIGGQREGLRVARVSKGQTNILTLHQRITSKGIFYYRVDRGAEVNIHVLGYSNTEPS